MEKKNSFEDKLLRLEEIGKEIAKNDIPLEKAATLYEEGMRLCKKCEKYIEEKELIIKNVEKENGLD